jgi:hypothetical protein
MFYVGILSQCLDGGLGDRELGFELLRHREAYGYVVDIGFVRTAQVVRERKSGSSEPLHPGLRGSCTVYRALI